MQTRGVELKTFKYESSYNLKLEEKQENPKETQQWRLPNTYTGHPKHEAIKAMPFSLCKVYIHHVLVQPAVPHRAVTPSGIARQRGARRRPPRRPPCAGASSARWG